MILSSVYTSHDKGEFGIVYKARLTSNKLKIREVAVKTLKGCAKNYIIVFIFIYLNNLLLLGQFDDEEIESLLEECLKMSHFKHAHVMSLVGVCIDIESTPLIIMPYMENGSLLKYLKRERNRLTASEENDEDEVCIASKHRKC